MVWSILKKINSVKINWFRRSFSIFFSKSVSVVFELFWTFLGLFFVNMVWSFYNNFNSRIFLMFLSLHLSILHQKQKAISKSITVWFVDMARTKWPTTNCIHIKYKMTIAQNLSINCNCQSRISIRNTIVDYGREKLKSQSMSLVQIRNPSRLKSFRIDPNPEHVWQEKTPNLVYRNMLQWWIDDAI